MIELLAERQRERWPQNVLVPIAGRYRVSRLFNAVARGNFVAAASSDAAALSNSFIPRTML
jgi:hypothetical protein